MKSLSVILSTFLILCLGLNLRAESTLKGRVVDEQGDPVSHVTIISDAIKIAIESDDKGEFIAVAKGDGPVRLVFSHVSYIPRTIVVEPGGKAVTVALTAKVYLMDGMTVTAGRAVEGQTPIAFVNIDRETIDRDHDIGDFPGLLTTTPNLYSFSDAGGGLGYSYMSIRGFDARRIPVYINGIPLNDPEDHALYFIDLPDFAASVDDIQVQRGIGNSLYGDAAFGGSVSLLTSPLAKSRLFVSEFGYGGFRSNGKNVGLMRKSSIAYSTGLTPSGWSFSGRWVNQYSDGYRKKSWYDGAAYYISVGRLDSKSITTVNIYGGPIKTHAAWDGVNRQTLDEDRRSNPYVYDNETDNFNQPHFELHNIYNLSDNLVLNNSLYHIHGDGYYEQLKNDADLIAYGLSENEDETSDLVRRKLVDKNQWGINSRAILSGNRHETVIGASYYYFESDHWGEVVWAKSISPSFNSVSTPHRYYQYSGEYNNFSVFSSRLQKVGDRINLSAQVHLRYLHKSINTTPMGLYEERKYDLDWLFLSPRIGATFAIAENISAFGSFSIASHEPNDDMIDDADDPAAVPRLNVIDSSVTPVIYGDPTFGPERLYNFELGFNYHYSRMTFDLNLFWMEYRNEIVPDGGLTDDGFPTYGNAERSVHRGIETAFALAIGDNLTIAGNFAINDNLIKKYDQNVYDWDSGNLTVIEHRNVVVPNFPNYLGNLTIDNSLGPFRLVYRIRVVGRQYVSLAGRYQDRGDYQEDVSIRPYTVSSLKSIFSLGSIFEGIDLSIEGRIDNLFNKKYETYGYSWGTGTDAWYYYWPAAERNWFVNLKLMIK